MNSVLIPALIGFLLMSSFPINADTDDRLQMRVHGAMSLPTLVYLPGLHGDWTLITSLRSALEGQVRFVEFTYPRTTEWSLTEYAGEIDRALSLHGIHEGWLLAESFGSQVAWAMLHRQHSEDAHLKIEGIVLAGGFVKHPNRPGVALLKRLVTGTPEPIFHGFLRVYARYARLRHRRAPETFACIDEFIARRTYRDRQAMRHRLSLIASNRPEQIVRQAGVPVYALSGFWDPIVPRVRTKYWLKKNCSDYGGSKTLYNADHTVLATQPLASANTILSWMKPENSPAGEAR